MANPTTSETAGDWATQAADAVERLVDTARQKVTNPALKLGRAVVYGLVIALVALVSAPLIGIALVRLLVVLTGKAWAADFIVGALFLIVGAMLWSRRTPKVAAK